MGSIKAGNVITHPKLQGEWLVADVEKSTDRLWDFIISKYQLHPVVDGAVCTDTVVWAELSNVYSDTVRLHPPSEVVIVGDCVKQWSIAVGREVMEKPFASLAESAEDESAFPF